MSNPSPHTVTFEAFSNQPRRYTVSPAQGTIAASGSAPVTVAVRTEKEAALLLAQWKASGEAPQRDAVSVATKGGSAQLTQVNNNRRAQFQYTAPSVDPLVLSVVALTKCLPLSGVGGGVVSWCGRPYLPTSCPLVPVHGGAARPKHRRGAPGGR